MQYIVIIGAVVQLVGIVSYIKETLKGNTKPDKVTWLLWSVAPLIAAFAGFIDGVRWAVLPVFISGFGPLLVFIASFINKNAYWKLEKFDYLCGFCSVLALVLWGITKEPVVAIVFAIASDGLAAVPTLIKSWKYPETETVDVYTTGLFGALTSFTVIKMWSFAEIAFPIYLVVASSVFIVSFYRKRIFRKEFVGKE
ncbi:MAG: hypothetical protein AABY84_06645 [Candidatus Firestonebacteria bacterium]